MGRNLESPFIPSDAGSRLGFGFFSNSFMSARSFLSDSAGFASGAPIGGESPHARPQYRGRFRGKSRELALNDHSHPSNSYELSLVLTAAAPSPLTVSNTVFSGSVPCSRAPARRALLLADATLQLLQGKLCATFGPILERCVSNDMGLDMIARPSAGPTESIKKVPTERRKFAERGRITTTCPRSSAASSPRSPSCSRS